MFMVDTINKQVVTLFSTFSIYKCFKTKEIYYCDDGRHFKIAYCLAPKKNAYMLGNLNNL